MNFDFSDECKAMAAELRRVLARVCPMSEVRRSLEQDGMSRATWQALAELGVLGAAVPERWGGSGLSALELAACAEEVGRACAPVPLLASVYGATEALLLAGSEAQRERWLPRLTSGTCIGTLALGTGLMAHAGRLSGRIPLVRHGALAALLVVVDDDGACLVDLEQSGVERLAHPVLDPGCPLATITMHEVTAEAMPNLTGAPAILGDRAAALLAFEQLGGAERALEMACGYALQRRTFGRVVASYQAIKHKLADVWVKNQIARGHAYQAAWALTASPPSLPLAAAAARVACSEAFEFAAQENLQVHGGIGFTWEADCHPLYKRARSTALVLGPVLQWKQGLSALLDTSHEVAHGL